MMMMTATAHDAGSFYRSVVSDVPLPLPAAEKLRDLRHQADDAHAVLTAAMQQLREAQTERGHAELERQLAFRPDPHADKKVQDIADIRLARAREKVERAQALVSERETRWTSIAQLVASLDAWLRKLPDELDVVLFPASKLPTLKRGERPADVVQKVRADIARLAADLRRVQSAPIPSATAKIQARAQVGELVERGRPDVFGLVESGGPITFPKAWHYLPDGKPWAEPDALALAAWLDPDKLIARLEAEIDNLADDANAIDPETRVAEERRLRTEILAAERLEESAIMQAAEDGVQLLRRPAADPRSILLLADHVGEQDHE